MQCMYRYKSQVHNHVKLVLETASVHPMCALEPLYTLSLIYSLHSNHVFFLRRRHTNHAELSIKVQIANFITHTHDSYLRRPTRRWRSACSRAPP
uniref:Uncharacterized protein n=1 Tax=Oryza brachyantha TaxID=4533 RepID=J3LYT5_ORYBR